MNCGCDKTSKRPECPDHSPDSRTLGYFLARLQGRPVLGPGLGAGVVGGGLTDDFTLPKPGGGLVEPVRTIQVLGEPEYPRVRQDFHFDYSTPDHLGWGGPLPANTGLWRALGGMGGAAYVAGEGLDYPVEATFPGDPRGDFQ